VIVTQKPAQSKDEEEIIDVGKPTVPSPVEKTTSASPKDKSTMVQ